MSTSYQHLVLADIKPGMILSDELIDPQGKVLLPKGAVLNAATIAALPRHGIEVLPIVCEAGPGADAAPDLAQRAQRLAWLFRKNDPDNDDDWASAILRRYVEDFRLEREIEQ